MKHTLFILLFFLTYSISAHNYLSHFLKVRLYAQSKVYAVQFKPEKGVYKIVGDGKHKFILDAQSQASIIVNGDSLLLKVLDDTIGVFFNVNFSSDHISPAFGIKATKPERKLRNYDNNCSFINIGGQLQIVNHIELEHYVAGSVQAEGGSMSPLEYQKIQAVLCRTFAIKNLFRHEDEGFDICDHVHCQAYNSRSLSKSVINATFSTLGEVVVDADLNLITSAYHSNSGGQTANSEDAWSLPSAYLKSINDSFALGMPNATWEKTISKQQWMNYLNSKLKLDFSEDSTRQTAFGFQQLQRKAAITFGSQRIALKDVRNDLKLKSSFFSIIELDDNLIFKGKGFGHGVGLCQEGAMVMAKQGYNYKKILSFYYSKTKILSIDEMNFFKE
jgi:stage II sporulation protein D